MTNTIPNVPRDWFDRVHALLYKVAYENTPEGLEAECLGSFIPGILSAPSPAGVDGLEVRAYEDSGGALYTAKLLEIMAVDSVGCEPLCRLSDATAIIDGLRGEVERSKQFAAGHVLTSERISESLHAVEDERDQQAQRIVALDANYAASNKLYRSAAKERDQQAQRIGELEGLLRNAFPRIDITKPVPLDEKAHCCEYTIYVERERLHKLIDAALSAGKEGE